MLEGHTAAYIILKVNVRKTITYLEKLSKRSERSTHQEQLFMINITIDKQIKNAFSLHFSKVWFYICRETKKEQLANIYIESYTKMFTSAFHSVGEKVSNFSHFILKYIT